MTDKYVVVITGGRKFHDEDRVYQELAEYDTKTTLIRHGGAPGADQLAAWVAGEMGFEVKEVRADWDGPCSHDCHHGPRRKREDGTTYCQMAGYRRNQRMLDMGADEVHAFPGENGTRDTITRALNMNIKVTGWNGH